jgi:hypothetical protein
MAVASFNHLFDYLYVGKARKMNTDPDIMSWDEGMRTPYRSGFLEACDKEIRELSDHGTWEEVPISSVKNHKIVPNQWVLRVKRTSEGDMRKLKSRLVIRGDLQEETDDDNSSPVAAWPSVRSFLIISIISGWKTISIDFENAFVQSYLPEDKPVWMALPRGYQSSKGEGYCLRLIKSLYGLREAPRLFYEHTAKAFRKLGLTPSEHDECLWYGDNIMVVQYVDDCGISAPTQDIIDQFLDGLREYGLSVTLEGSFDEFLGIKFERREDGSINCTQKGLIKKILTAACMEDCNPNVTPAATAALGSDPEGEPMSENWNYRGICGMLLYLSTNTRPDISFAVSQVCRFSNEPKQSHAAAVKHILRYLKGTSNDGTIIKPKGKHGTGFAVDMYVDADFAGLFGREPPRNPDSVRSRSGYIIILGGWPLIWKSSLQGHLSQSTLEAEYSALSSSLKVFLPLLRQIKEIIAKCRCKKLEDTKIHATVFEDNQSTYYLATNQRITSRTRYMLSKWHWFWDSYNNGLFSIVKCPTEEMSADYLTKGLGKTLFLNNRKRVQGW